MSRRLRILLSAFIVIAATLFLGSIGYCEETAAVAAGQGSAVAWWMWPIILFVFTFFLGILAVVAGVGGGVLFVPIVSSFFPFNLDFVRGAGLLVALSGALSAGPGLLRRGLANLRLALPMALIASTFSIFGAMVGLALPTNVVQAALGGTIIMIVIIMATARRSDFPDVKKADTLSSVLRISGIYYEESQGKEINWQIHRTPLGLSLFILIGFMAGMFGLGAGWANVPVLNLLLGAPLKISVATSVFLLSITDSAAAWVYVNKGAVLPLIAVPSVAGMMLGTRIGVRVLAKAKPKAVKWIVVSILFLAGLRALLKGLGIWR
ncbi:sulfite exporter TauE/SafE [bacterium BMS3Abin07]|nr:sulfite exporter TauE/SafE [bacterium BMS3Abin07]GBE32637.1 sulfite exporter TauE/SafE [bacterium BMS3Bbin05]HDL20513.1 sulfite exporter TauE/SafE family protein [Nitrospirota bacterium]HDO23220.1 sulfite exporter TauE/SafE family protein [Nitrospirota bacterium]HDZ88117.1 sulfite exporter TauE/SafE family protein [Nitrospirota bacterium]